MSDEEAQNAWVKYETPPLLPHDEAEQVFRGDDPNAICNVMAGAGLFDPDLDWVEAWCVSLASHEDADVRRIAATCLGHVARRFGGLDAASLVTLERLRRDPVTHGAAEDAFDDYRMFALKGIRSAFAALFWGAMAAGVVLLLGTVVALPTSVWAAAWVVLVGSACGVFTLAFIGARRGREPLRRALWDAIRQSFRWLLSFTP